MRVSVTVWGVVQAISVLCWSISVSSSYCEYSHGESESAANCVAAPPQRREPKEYGEIIDITHRFTQNTPVGNSNSGIGQFVTLLMSMKNGSDYNFSELKLRVHAGTHVDAPGHFYDNYFDQGFDVDTLDLNVLNGD